MTPPAKSGDLYFNVETYFYGVNHENCHPFLKLPPYFQLVINQNGNAIISYKEFAFYSTPTLVLEANYAAGDVFEIVVEYDWGFGSESRDYTVLVHST